jgi:DNA repair protein RadA/Sms
MEKKCRMEHHCRGDSKTRKGGLKSEPNPSNRAPKPLKINEIDSTEEIRMDTTDAELNRVLGGGIVPGSSFGR